MTILKYKEPSATTDPRRAAGERQEQDVAFYLRRAFKNDPNILVLNDYRFTHNDETAQIDHLIVHRAGFIVIESKSIYGEVKVNAQGEWSRSYKGQWSGMPSPIRQAELQMELLRDFMGAHVEHFLGKMLLGRVQQKVRFREWDVLCTVSSSCILHRESMPSELSKRVVKSEFIADEVQGIGGYSRITAAFSSKPHFSAEEMSRIGTFLLEHYQQLGSTVLHPTEKPIPELPPKPVKTAVASAPPPLQKETTVAIAQLNETPPTYNASAQTDIIGVTCKKCGSKENLTAMYGQYGYYVKCGQCETNTSMKTACPECNSSKTRVRKRKDEYWLQCECQALRKLYQQG
ncbi:NERD domain-containing protein [Marinobacterium weihaiense]|uniref:NERD domain-containing protein n=1 Tax=Marinobacterium weihaiense TaxID=2851016 RepID=A0ABS6MDR2_9GAMM|nr:NERD domain-containing protein [Marinobacterium weihaiense]MBV0934453.1 NERD domain-containing protein [Marinobacterium weihaiense]